MLYLKVRTVWIVNNITMQNLEENINTVKVIAQFAIFGFDFKNSVTD